MAKRKTKVTVTKGRTRKRPIPAPETKKAAKTKKPSTPLKSSPKKNGRGRPAKMTDKEAGEAHKESSLRRQRKIDQAARDIAGEEWEVLLEGINWERRLATHRSLQRFSEVYIPGTFYLGWSEDQLRCVKKTETVFIGDGMFALAMPRGGGKTAIVRSGITWGTLHGWKRFPFNVGSTDTKSLQTLEAVKTFLYGSPLLLQDFPEICFPVRKTENRFHGTKGQTFRGVNTYIEWGAKSVRFPCLILSPKEAEIFLNPRIGGKLRSWKEGEEPVVPFEDGFIPRPAGANIATAGITGSIRGEAETHPLTLEQPRPDVVVIDDVQKDQTAESPEQVKKLVMTIDGAVTGLAGPGGHVSVIMPCTVTREGDCSDHYLDTMKKPEYRGERCQLVSSWPEGITDTQISLETKAGKCWNTYIEVRRQAYRDFEHHSRDCEHCRDNLLDPCQEGKRIQYSSTEYYLENRSIMDEGFVVTWEERYGNPDRQPDGSVKRKDWKEISAQQHAMNLRMKSPETFPAEYQNRGRKLTEEGEILITAGQLAEKAIATPRGCVPVDAQFLSAFLDLQNEIFFYAVLAVSHDFTGTVVQYGTYPEISTRYFTKNQTEGWGLLTREFFARYPEHKHKAVKTESGRVRAPLEAKIYHALSVAVPTLLNMKFEKQDEHLTKMSIGKLAIDTRWGQASDVTKRFIRESGLRNVIPYYGQSFPPTNKQLEEYQRTGAYKGWLFEDQIHPNLKDPKWVIRPNPDGQWYMQADVDRLKDFLFARLASPMGSPGSISLHEGTADLHELFSDHICRSEYPEPINARGMTKNKWREREGAFDNDWLDCLAGCCAVSSIQGACLRTGGEPVGMGTRKKISDRWKEKRG